MFMRLCRVADPCHIQGLTTPNQITSRKQKSSLTESRSTRLACSWSSPSLRSCSWINACSYARFAERAQCGIRSLRAWRIGKTYGFRQNLLWYLSSRLCWQGEKMDQSHRYVLSPLSMPWNVLECSTATWEREDVVLQEAEKWTQFLRWSFTVLD